jgi:hypothetical protein
MDKKTLGCHSSSAFIAAYQRGIEFFLQWLNRIHGVLWDGSGESISRGFKHPMPKLMRKRQKTPQLMGSSFWAVVYLNLNATIDIRIDATLEYDLF